MGQMRHFRNSMTRPDSAVASFGEGMRVVSVLLHQRRL